MGYFTFEYAVEKLDTFLEQLAYSLIGAGYGVGGELAVDGWLEFMGECEDALIEDYDLFDGEFSLTEFLDCNIADRFYEFCEEKDISDF
jgi:hypothetical protein